MVYSIWILWNLKNKKSLTSEQSLFRLFALLLKTFFSESKSGSNYFVIIVSY